MIYTMYLPTGSLREWSRTPICSLVDNSKMAGQCTPPHMLLQHTAKIMACFVHTAAKAAISVSDDGMNHAKSHLYR